MGFAVRCRPLRGTPGVWLGLVLLSACASAPSTPTGKPDLLQFLDQPGITRQEVIARLGPPSGTFIRDNVATYRLGHNAAGYFVVPPAAGRPELGWEGVAYDLVLAFNSDATLREHRLIPIHAAATP
jgi:hypothetical protein